MLEVVSGVLVNGTRILMSQRPVTKECGLAWETPGGKVEPGETHHDALRRELDEELGLAIGEIDEEPLWRSKLILSVPFFLSFYRIRTYTGVPTPTEGQGWGWFDERAFYSLTVTPGNAAAMPIIGRAVWSRSS